MKTLQIPGGLGFPVSQEAHYYPPGTVLGDAYERDYFPLGGIVMDRGDFGFPVKEVRTAPWGTLLRGLGDPCPSSWLEPFNNCECPAGTVTFAGKEGIFTCLAPSAIPAKPDGTVDPALVSWVKDAALSIACKATNGWFGCPKITTNANGTVVVTSPPWYSTTGGMLGILAGAAVLGTGIYFVAKR